MLPAATKPGLDKLRAFYQQVDVHFFSETHTAVYLGRGLGYEFADFCQVRLCMAGVEP